MCYFPDDVVSGAGDVDGHRSRIVFVEWYLSNFLRFWFRRWRLDNLNDFAIDIVNVFNLSWGVLLFVLLLWVFLAFELIFFIFKINDIFWALLIPRLVRVVIGKCQIVIHFVVNSSILLHYSRLGSVILFLHVCVLLRFLFVSLNFSLLLHNHFYKQFLRIFLFSRCRLCRILLFGYRGCGRLPGWISTHYLIYNLIP